VVITNALPKDYYNELERTFPEAAILSRPYGENQRIDLHAKDSYGKVDQVWEDFIAYHTSNAFWQDVWKVFGPAINVVYPYLYRMNEAGTSVRGMGPGPLQLECQPGVNTPTTTRSKVRGPHLDNPIELYGGLFYMGEGEGDLMMYKYDDKPEFYGKLEIRDESVTWVKRVRYARNTLVMFLNTYGAIHGVSARGPSEDWRRLVSIAGELPAPLFKVGHGSY
jgi:hypothetical protein